MNSFHPFDPLAPTYDSDFTDTAIGRYLRGRVQARLTQHFKAGDHVLELGCGTGEDALWLAGRGVSVLATDTSAAMLDITLAKAAGYPLVRVARLDLRELPVASCQMPEGSHQSSVVNRQSNMAELKTDHWELGTRNSELHPAPSTQYSALSFDGVFASFGPLNCLDEWRTLAVWLAARVKPGGVAAFGVMSPLCLWEMAWHGAHGDFRTAFRRWRQGVTFQALPSTPSPPAGRGSVLEETPLSEAMVIHYPTIQRLTRDFAPYFRRMHVEPLGLFLPPSDVYGAVEKRPRLFKLLMSLEERFGKYRILALLADHYWMEFERTNR
ncbi:MAG: class I SAM-dependent methyltransferase [Chloroflexi bacterium]|nr:class I SAM-dependent methyltransferase [Chloroflexota bacterium]